MKKKLFVIIAILNVFICNIAMCSDYEGHWAKENIDMLKQREIIQGDEYGNIKPDNNITRAEFVKIINKSMGYMEKGNSQYADIQGGEWYAEEFLIAKKLGYIKGDEEGNANPITDITRAEVSVILSRILLITNEERLSFLDESEIPQWAYKEIAGLVKKDIINGYEDNTFKANNNITRGEAITLISRVLTNQESEKAKNEALLELKDKNEDMEITYRGDEVGIITGAIISGTVNNNNDIIKALEEIKEIYGIKEVEEEFEIEERVKGKKYVLKQMYKGIEVYGGEIVLVLNENKQIDYINSSYIKNINISIEPIINAEEVKGKLEGEIQSIELIIYITDENKPLLAWKVEKSGKTEIVNANTGIVLDTITYIDYNGYSIPSSVKYDTGKDIYGKKISFPVMQNGSTYYLGTEKINMFSTINEILDYSDIDYNDKTHFISTNNIWDNNLGIEDSWYKERLSPIVLTVYNNAVRTDYFYTNILKDDTVDKYNIYMITSGEDWPNNAYADSYAYKGYFPEDEEFWGAVVLGNDDNYTSLGISMDILAHEMTHLVTRKNVGWKGNEARTLGEAYSDIMGELIEIHYNEADEEWTSGQNNATYDRNAKNPEKDKNPSKVGGEYFDNKYSDSHTNMTVITHAAYLMYENGIKDEEKLAKLWYESLNYLNSSSDFKECRYAIMDAANDINMTDEEKEIIEKAFDEVGITSEISRDFNIIVGNSGYSSRKGAEISAKELPQTISLQYTGNGKIEGWYIYSKDSQPVSLGTGELVRINLKEEDLPEFPMLKIKLVLSNYEGEKIEVESSIRFTEVKSINNDFWIKVGTQYYWNWKDEETTIEEKDLPLNVTLGYDGEGTVEGWYISTDESKELKISSSKGIVLNLNKNIIGDSLKVKILLKIEEKEDKSTFVINIEKEQLEITGEEITVILGGKEYVVTKDNPLKEGVYLTGMVLKNNIDKKVVRWEAFNNNDNKYEEIYNAETTGEYKNTVDFYMKEIHYKKIDESIYCIKIKAIYEDGTEIEKEIYQRMIKIQVPWNEEKVVTSVPLVMRWNGESNEEYDIRLVRIISETDKQVVIGEGDNPSRYKGNSFTIEANTLLIPNSRYRLAVKSADGIYYDIVEFTTVD